MDKSLLKYYINRAGITQSELADYMGISLSALQYKMRGRIRWTIKDAKDIKECLDLSNEEVIKIFMI